MIVGVARPHAVVDVPREEATVVLAVDVSRSMKAEDVEPTRLEAAAGGARSSSTDVPRSSGSASSPSPRARRALPPTEDRALVSRALDTLKPGEGTAIGDAVASRPSSAAVSVSEDGSIPPTAVLVISDGARDGGTCIPTRPRTAREGAERADLHGARRNPDGVVEEELPGGLRRIIQVPPEPRDVLREVAEASGGKFFTAADEESLKQVYEEPRSRLGQKRKEREITDFFAGRLGGAAARRRPALGDLLPGGFREGARSLRGDGRAARARRRLRRPQRRTSATACRCASRSPGPWVVVPTGAAARPPEVSSTSPARLRRRRSRRRAQPRAIDVGFLGLIGAPVNAGDHDGPRGRLHGSYVGREPRGSDVPAARRLHAGGGGGGRRSDRDGPAWSRTTAQPAGARRGETMRARAGGGDGSSASCAVRERLVGARTQRVLSAPPADAA